MMYDNLFVDMHGIFIMLRSNDVIIGAGVVSGSLPLYFFFLRLNPNSAQIENLDNKDKKA